jgi:ATP-dependent DNA helicase RecQ
MPKTPSQLHQTLLSLFGYSSFRPHQEQIIQEIIENRDVFAVMPTGGGKSICYQLPSKLMDGTCVVVSPLISLMKDQVDAALEVGLKAAYLNSSMTEADKQEVWVDLRSQNLDLIYVAPERFKLESFLTTIRQIKISLFAIDEAHCISEWGHDFRPDYLSLSNIVTYFPKVPVAAFTATATQKVQSDIMERLKLRNPYKVRASFDRPNLYYGVQQREKPKDQILQFLKKKKGQSGIIYRTTRKNVESTADFLISKGIKALAYHAGLSVDERKNNQEAFNNDEIDVVVATVAFGMGIDKSNVRFVLHVDLPKNMEGYYQETGRGGRDGESAECLLLFSRGDIPKIRYFIDPIVDEEEKKRALNNLNLMTDFAGLNICRRKQILAYFNEVYPKENCNNCDVCLGDVEQVEATIDAQKILSAVVRTGERFGATHIVDVVTGADTQRIRDWGHHDLKTYGVGKDKPKRFWRDLLNDLEAKGALFKEGAPFPILKLGELGSMILLGQQKFSILKKKEASKATQKLKSKEMVSHEADSELFEMLRGLRMKFAKKKRVPPFVIFSDKSLYDMATLLPTSKDEFLMVHGVGKKKIELYGQAFLSAILSYQNNS